MFDHLTITGISKITAARIRKGQPIERDKAKFTRLKKFIGSNRRIQQIAKKVLSYKVFDEREKTTNITIQLHNMGENENAQSFESSFGYADDIQELNCAIKYYKQIQDRFPTASESKVLYESAVEQLTNYFSRAEIPVFLNFGVNLSYLDDMLAERFPEIQFVGIDRSNLTKAFNESRFVSRDNLELIVGDIFELLNSRQFSGGMFFHMRTVTFLPSGFTRKLYTAVRKAGFKYIVGFEPLGLSRQTGRPYEFSLTPQPSVAYRGHAFIHNYPNLLFDAGYSVIDSQLIKTDHAHEDYRIVNFVAELDSFQQDHRSLDTK